jgi:beta-alanine--pyruvate transaminase
MATATRPALSASDLEAYWMPFTANRAFKQAPRLLARAEGMHYEDVDGNRILDACSGLWCVNAGHGRRQIVEAIARSAAELDFAPSFRMGHPAPFVLANRLRTLLPPGLSHVFYTNSGSESVDTAMKIALAYWRSKGEPQRTRFVGRLRGYHGVGFGGISVGGIEANRAPYAAQLLPGVDHLPHTHGVPGNQFSVGQPPHGADLADQLDAIVAERGAGTIAACFVEPVAGSTGVLVPPVGYLERLRAACDRHGILLVFDEVITGFGRVGAPFAAQRFGVTPDLLTVAKGITNGSVPMGAVFVKGEIYETTVNAAPRGIDFFHGYTYSAHPLACAAAMATLDVYEADGLLTRARTLEDQWGRLLHGLRDLPNVIDVRNFGLMGAVELASREGLVGARGMAALQGAFRRGLLVRVTADTIAMSPPLIAEPAHLDEIAGILREVIRDPAVSA